MITFIKNNDKLSLSLLVIFLVYTVSFFIQQSKIDALEKDKIFANEKIRLAELEIIEKSKPSEIEKTKQTINYLYDLREEEKWFIDDMKNKIITSEWYVYQIESKIRCEKENLLWTWWIDCHSQWENYPLVK